MDAVHSFIIFWDCCTWTKNYHSLNAYSVCCVTLVLHALPCDWSQLTLATNAVAEWFNRVWLQNFMNELALNLHTIACFTHHHPSMSPFLWNCARPCAWNPWYHCQTSKWNRIYHKVFAHYCSGWTSVVLWLCPSPLLTLLTQTHWPSNDSFHKLTWKGTIHIMS